MDSILIVDDNPENLKVLSAILKEEGYAVRVAKNGKRALDSIRAESPNLVLLDIQMPKMDGYEVCRRLKGDEKYKSIPVIFISAMMEPFNKVMAFKAGGDDYMTKPLDAEEVKIRVGTHLKMYGYRKQLKERNIELLQQFKSTFEQAAVGIAHIDQETLRFIKINRRFSDILGYDQEELLDRTLETITPPRHIKADQLDIQRLTENGAPAFSGEKQYIRADGSAVWCNITISRVTNAGGSFPNYFVAILEDISPQKKAQNELKINRERLALATMAAKVGIWDWDIKNDRLIWDNTLYELYAVAEADFGGTLAAWTQFIHPEDRPRAESEIRTALREMTTFESEFRIVRPDETVRYVKGIGAVHKNHRDEPVRMIGVNWDTTESKELDLKQLEYERRIQQAQKLEAIGTLAGGIAHDFNNILSSIIGFTELELEGAEQDSRSAYNLRQVLAAGMRARELVRQILTIARRTDEKTEPMRVDVIVKEALKFLRSSIPASIAIRHDTGSKSLVMGNATQIHQVVMNLCTNAAHAMAGTDGILEVELKDVAVDNSSPMPRTGPKPGNYIEIKVSDTGVGIPPEIIDSIFEPYFTTKKPGEGTGIGLAVVHGIVEGRGGTITVESRPSKGSVFKVYLPIIQARNAPEADASEPPPSGNERILFVDDEDSILEMSGLILESLGYTVTTRISSTDALELFRLRPDDFDLVITDMTMPDMAGDVLARRIMEIRHDTPIILCSGYSQKMSKEAASKIGIKAIADKPIIKTDLAGIVRKVIDEAKSGT